MSDQELNERITRLTAALLQATAERDARKLPSRELAKAFRSEENAGRAALGYPLRSSWI